MAVPAGSMQRSVTILNKEKSSNKNYSMKQNIVKNFMHTKGLRELVVCRTECDPIEYMLCNSMIQIETNRDAR